MDVSVVASVKTVSDKSESFLVSSCSRSYTESFVQRKRKIMSESLYLEFMVDNVTLKHIFPVVPLFVPVHIIPQILHIHASNINVVNRYINVLKPSGKFRYHQV
jgi:hypothetical protein